jgi:hypothetical protein
MGTKVWTDTRSETGNHFDVMKYMEENGAFEAANALIDSDLDALPSISMEEAERRMAAHCAES